MRIWSFILVIDSYLVRKGLVSVLNHMQGVRIITEFDAADPFIKYAQNHAIDFLIISQSLFSQSSPAFLARPELLEKTILLKEGSNVEIDGHPGKQEEAYASIQLSERREEITRKIRELLNSNGSVLSSDYAMVLTQREKTIVRHVSLGLTNQQIADELFLSTHTVITHRKNISGKLGIKSVSGLTVYAIVNNIITIEEVTSKPTQ